MKKFLGLMMACILALSLLPAAQAQPLGSLPPDRLISLTHNAPNTGKMLPEQFDPFVNTYLLTVASWVSRITFEPVAADPAAVITVNGQVVASGQKSQVIQMSDDPQAVSITVSVYGAGNALMEQNTYTVYLQRRPSERRTRVSAGFIEHMEVSKGVATVSADLVTLKYDGFSNLSSYNNETVYLYKYKTSASCLFYYGTMANPIRATDAQTFLDNYLTFGSNLYYLVYIEDEIVAIMPYSAG